MLNTCQFDLQKLSDCGANSYEIDTVPYKVLIINENGKINDVTRTLSELADEFNCDKFTIYKLEKSYILDHQPFIHYNKISYIIGVELFRGIITEHKACLFDSPAYYENFVEILNYQHIYNKFSDNMIHAIFQMNYYIYSDRHKVLNNQINNHITDLKANLNWNSQNELYELKKQLVALCNLTKSYCELPDSYSCINLNIIEFNSLHRHILTSINNIDNFERCQLLKLDYNRNKLLNISFYMEICSCMFGFGAFISGIFGMNLYNRYEDDKRAFYIVTISTSNIIIFMIIIIYFISLRYLKL